MASVLYMCKGFKFDRNYNHVHNFTPQNILDAVAVNKIAESGDFTYIRGDEGDTIKVQFPNSLCKQANYVAFRNTNLSDRWFFGWIDRTKVLSNNVTELYITIDYWSTYFSYLTIHPCYVIREHVPVSSDVPGNWIQNENLETGDYLSLNNIYLDFSDLGYIVLATTQPNGESTGNGYTLIGNLPFFGIVYYTTNRTKLATLLQLFNSEGRAGNVVAVYAIPKNLINGEETETMIMDNQTLKTFTKTFSKPTSLGSYTPVNKKLLTYPYCALTVTNNNGTASVLKYENFSNNPVSLKILGIPSIGGSVICYPENYATYTSSSPSLFAPQYDYGVVGGKFPTLGWTNDAYTNWLTSQAINNNITTGTGVAEIGVGGLVTAFGITSGSIPTIAGGLALAGSGYKQIFNNLIEKENKKFLPTSYQGNTNASDVLTSNLSNTFIFKEQVIKPQFAKVIDDYFSRYGYVINQVKMPNITSRPKFNYIQVSDDSVFATGDIPQDALDVINKVVQRGTTVWHTYSDMLNLSVNNR